MRVTEQQILVLFDVTKSAMMTCKEGFAGYSKQELTRLINDIISQQDNGKFVELSAENNEPVQDKDKEEVNITDLSKAGKMMNSIGDNFWD